MLPATLPKLGDFYEEPSTWSYYILRLAEQAFGERLF